MGVDEGALIAGRYRIERELGRGAAGVVMRASDRRLDRPVAVKLFDLARLGRLPDEGADHRMRLWREARLAAAVAHPGVVSVYDFGDDGQEVFLVMELVEAPTLREVLARAGGRLDPERAALIAAGLAEVLEATHGLPLVHRDIKPDNVFVAGEPGAPIVRLTDFGLAFLARAGEDCLGRITDGRVLTGTPAYMAPEQAAGREVGPAADIYALGCVLFEMVTGSPPFTGSLPEVLARHLYLPPTSLAERGPTAALPDGLEEIAAAALAKRPGDRPSAPELARRLCAVVGDQAPTPRGAGRADERALRMVPETTARPGGSSAVALPGSARVALVGALTPAFMDALRADGLEPVSDQRGDGGQAARVLLATVGDVADLARVTAQGRVPILARVPAPLLRQVAELVRAGAADAIAVSAPPAAVVRKLRRLIDDRAGRAEAATASEAEGTVE